MRRSVRACAIELLVLSPRAFGEASVGVWVAVLQQHEQGGFGIREACVQLLYVVFVVVDIG